MKTIFQRFVKDELGATAIEYGLIASLIARCHHCRRHRARHFAQHDLQQPLDQDEVVDGKRTVRRAPCPAALGIDQTRCAPLWRASDCSSWRTNCEH